MRILLTNDDGIAAPGLHALAGMLAASNHELRILAPSGERSGSSSGLGVVRDGTRSRLVPALVPGLTGIVAQSVDAPPAYAVRAVCAGTFDWAPELVVAGINDGFNTGRMVLHSGTVGAALTAASLDLPGIAVSIGPCEPTAYRTAAILVDWLVQLVSAQPDPLVYNLNVPARSLEHLAGVVGAPLSPVALAGVAFDLHEGEVNLRRTDNRPPFDAETDADRLSKGYATVSILPTPWDRAPSSIDVAPRLQSRWAAHVAAYRG
jgi:5'-nucleotidase